MEVAERRRALAVSGAVLLAVAWPVVSSVLGGDGDSFPLSTYPMFANDRGDEAEVPTVVLVDDAGEVHLLDPETIAGTDQVVQVWENLRDVVAAGPAAAAEHCREVAGRVDGDPGDRIEVVVERHDVVAWAAGDREPLARRVIATCEAGG